MAPHSGSWRGERPPAPDALPLAVADNHTHLDIGREGRPAPAAGEMVAQAAAVGVDRLVQVGCDLESARFTERVVAEHPSVLGAVAIHPNEAPGLVERDEVGSARAEIERIAALPRVRAVGETGLDYFRTGADGVAAQQDSFRWHIDLAKRLDLAMQIHDRDAHEDVLRILEQEGAPERTVLHCFSGDIGFARECVARGYHLSFAGTVTFRNARDLRDALAIVPHDQLLVETDAPYLTPSPYRGAVNGSYLVPLTVRAMAEVLALDVPTLCATLSANTERVYGPW